MSTPHIPVITNDILRGTTPAAGTAHNTRADPPEPPAVQAAAAPPGIYREWRVTGQHTNPTWRVINPEGYDFVWSVLRTPQLCANNDEAERAARGFMASAGVRQSLTELTLTCRTVAVSRWVPAEPAGQPTDGDTR